MRNNLFKYTSAYSKGGTPELIEGDIFKVSIPTDIESIKENIDGTVEKTREKTVEKTVEKTREKIIKLITINKNITIAEMAVDIGLSTRAIEKQIAKLKDNNIIKRIGSDKNGYWEISSV